MKTEEITISCKQIYDKEEINKISEDQIRFGLNMELLNHLESANAILYSKEPDLFDKIDVIAKITVIVYKKDD